MYIYLIIPHSYIQTLDSPSVRQLVHTFRVLLVYPSICQSGFALYVMKCPMIYIYIYIYDSVLGVVHISCVLCMHIFICDRYNINKNIKQ